MERSLHLAAMSVTVGLINSGYISSTDGKFHADTVTIYLEREERRKDGRWVVSKDTENMHDKNFEAVALAVARKRLNYADVFPIEVSKPEWLPTKKELSDMQAKKGN